MATPEKEMFDSFMHSKSKDAGTEEIHEKLQFPMTRYSDILGAPHMVPLDAVRDAYPDEYLLVTIGELTISDAEYNLCFGALTTI